MAEESDVGKIADASKEVAKTTSKAIDAAASVTSFLYRVVGEPIESAVGIYLSDPLRELRKRRLSDLQDKTEKHLLERGILETKALPPPVAIPLLEAASIETDENLHDLWAMLLAEAMNPIGRKIDKRFVFAMQQFTAESFVVLDYMWKYRNIVRNWTVGGRLLESYLGSNALRSFPISELKRVESIETDQVFHLIRIGLLQHPLQRSEIIEELGRDRRLRHSGHSVRLPNDAEVELTSLGVELLLATFGSKSLGEEKDI